MSKAKLAHYFKIIAERSGDYGSVWKAFNKILHRCPKMRLPDHSSIVAPGNTFSLFFIDKIPVPAPLTHTHTDSHSCILNPPDTRKVMQKLTCVTADEVSCLGLHASHRI